MRNGSDNHFKGCIISTQEFIKNLLPKKKRAFTRFANKIYFPKIKFLHINLFKLRYKQVHHTPCNQVSHRTEYKYDCIGSRHMRQNNWCLD